MIRTATPADVPVLLELVAELAEYEREPEAATGTTADYLAALFPTDAEPAVFAFVAEVEGAVAGMAIWFRTFSTWTGRHGIWLEDLYVRPAYRGHGLGADLMAELARVCLERGYPRLEWTVLDWNTPAIEVYSHLGAQAMEDWTTRRMTGAALRELAARAR